MMAKPTCPTCGANLLCPECDGRPVRLTREKADRALQAWNTRAKPPLARLSMLTTERKRKIKARMAICGGFDEYLQWLYRLIDEINRTPFLLGQNARGWMVTWDWLHHNEANAVKVLEGAYSGNPAGVWASRQTPGHNQPMHYGRMTDQSLRTLAGAGNETAAREIEQRRERQRVAAAPPTDLIARLAKLQDANRAVSEAHR